MGRPFKISRFLRKVDRKAERQEETLKLKRMNSIVRGTIPYLYKDVERYTDGFSEENLIGKFQFGKVYRGVINALPTIYLIVKVWEPREIKGYKAKDHEARLRDEYLLLHHEEFNFHPGLVLLFGYCREGDKLAVLYVLKHAGSPFFPKPNNTVHNLVPEDSFTWLQRINVALRFANLLKFLHGHNSMRLSFLVRSISAAHIMLDEEYNPTLFDFGMISGGLFSDKTVATYEHLCGCYGYIDPASGFAGEYSEKSDVFAFGVLLLMLITKRVCNEEDGLNEDVPFLCHWVQSQHTPKKSVMGFGKVYGSLVHHSLEADPLFVSSDGPRITKVAMRCVESYPSRRPTMKQVVRYLLNLHVVQRHAQVLDLV